MSYSSEYLRSQHAPLLPRTRWLNEWAFVVRWLCCKAGAQGLRFRCSSSQHASTPIVSKETTCTTKLSTPEQWPTPSPPERIGWLVPGAWTQPTSPHQFNSLFDKLVSDLTSQEDKHLSFCMFFDAALFQLADPTTMTTASADPPSGLEAFNSAHLVAAFDDFVASSVFGNVHHLLPAWSWFRIICPRWRVLYVGILDVSDCMYVHRFSHAIIRYIVWCFIWLRRQAPS